MDVKQQLEKIKQAILKTAQKNAGFRNALLRKPKEAIEQQFNVKLPDKVQVEVAKKSPRSEEIDLKFLRSEALSAKELEGVAGGIVELMGGPRMASTAGLEEEVAELKEELAEAKEEAEEAELEAEVMESLGAGHAADSFEPPKGVSAQAQAQAAAAAKAAAGAAQGPVDTIVKDVSGAAAGLVSGVPLVGGAAGKAVAGLGSAGTDAAKGLEGAVSDLFQGKIGNTIGDLANGAVNVVTDLGKGIVNTISSIFSGW